MRGEGFEPGSVPIAADVLGFDLEDAASAQQEELLDEILMVADVPDAGRDEEYTLRLAAALTEYMRKLLT